MIDITKPLELADGTPVNYVRPSAFGDASYIVIIGKNTTGRQEGQYRHFLEDGTHIHGEIPDLRNVVEAYPGAPSFPVRQLRNKQDRASAESIVLLSLYEFSSAEEALDFIRYED